MKKPTRLRLRRLAAGLRILDLVYRTGLSATRISQLERDDGPPAQPDELQLCGEALEAAETAVGGCGAPTTTGGER